MDFWANYVLRDIDLSGVMPTRSQLPTLPDDYAMPASFTEVVHRMHKACVFYLRPSDDYSLQALDLASADMYIFAQCMELTFGVGPALTSNLHMTICRLA